MRSLGFGTTESVFQADPGASSRAECHHGATREYEQESCVPPAPLTTALNVFPASIADRKGVLQ